MTIENAKDFIRLNGLIFWRVEKNGKVAFRSKDDDEETNGKKTPDIEETITFFDTNMNLFGPGAYTIVGRKKYTAGNAESRFYFTKEGEAATASNNIGIGSIGEVEKTFNAKLEAFKTQLEKEKLEFLHQQKIKDLEKRIKELEQKPTDISGALDKVSGVLGQAIQLYSITKGGSIAGLQKQVRPPVRPTPTAATPAIAENVTAEAQKIENSLERLAALTPTIADDLEALASFAENDPLQFQMILQGLKKQTNGNSTDE